MEKKQKLISNQAKALLNTNNLGKFSVLLLSAGRGSRLGKTGKIVPKSLLKIGNKTICYFTDNEIDPPYPKTIKLDELIKKRMRVTLSSNF